MIHCPLMLLYCSPLLHKINKAFRLVGLKAYSQSVQPEQVILIPAVPPHVRSAMRLKNIILPAHCSLAESFVFR